MKLQPPGSAAERIPVLSADGATALLKAVTGRVNLNNGIVGGAFWPGAADKVGHKVSAKTFTAAAGGSIASAKVKPVLSPLAPLLARALLSFLHLQTHARCTRLGPRARRCRPA